VSEQADPPALDVAAIIGVLNRHGVAYVVIGGVAAGAWAASLGVRIRPTLDIDLTPDTDQPNLRRLSDALRELGARIRTEGEPDGLASTTTKSHWVEPECGTSSALPVHSTCR
jgi:hypothetical protein